VRIGSLAIHGEQVNHVSSSAAVPQQFNSEGIVNSVLMTIVDWE
jgi:hypothetical protein